LDIGTERQLVPGRRVKTRSAMVEKGYMIELGGFSYAQEPTPRE
jgi:hypothetical protein